MSYSGHAVLAKNLTKSYVLASERRKFSFIRTIISGPKEFEQVHAVNNASFMIEHGETFGIVGLNGAGKTTLARLITGAIVPSSGKLYVDGKVSSLSAGAGLDANLTGLQNIQYKCLIHGMRTAQIKEIRDDIIAFADIGKYIEQPLRTYSSGMRARLGFAIASHVNPDILVVDEGLSVGDESFSHKCEPYFKNMKNFGKTIILVSHSTSFMREHCDRLLWLDKGNMMALGTAAEVIEPYKQFCLAKKEQSKAW